jgi:hypothetical protein
MEKAARKMKNQKEILDVGIEPTTTRLKAERSTN